MAYFWDSLKTSFTEGQNSLETWHDLSWLFDVSSEKCLGANDARFFTAVAFSFHYLWEILLKVISLKRAFFVIA